LVNTHEDALLEVLRSITAEHQPLVVLAAPALDDPIARLGPHEISPVITLHLEEVIPPSDEAAFTLWTHVQIDLAHFHAHLADYRLVVQPEMTSLSEHEGVTYTASYTTFHADAVTGCPVRERTYYFRQGPAVYSLRLCDYPERDLRLAFDFDQVVASVRIR